MVTIDKDTHRCRRNSVCPATNHTRKIRLCPGATSCWPATYRHCPAAWRHRETVSAPWGQAPTPATRLSGNSWDFSRRSPGILEGRTGARA